jgi:glucose-1-phosphate cytidylyltransferase
MKTVLLAGGKGTRLSEETLVRPKPMVEIGGKPILWHIMSMYAHHGHRDFVVACGYKGEQIKEYFLNFALHNNDYHVSLKDGARRMLKESPVDWQVTMVDTGLETLTGGRLLRLRTWLQEEGSFMLTYGDGLSDIDLGALVAFHRRHGKVATVTAVRPPARFGALHIEGERVTRFSEKPQSEEGWINGGFFVFEPAVFSYLADDRSTLEREPLERLAADGQLMAYRHEGFWQPMDTLRDKQHLEALWASGAAPWKTWA